jgi:hypothetical protein
VISGAGRPERQDQAMRSLRQHLVDPRAGLIALLTPPFDRARPDPGYIQGYLPESGRTERSTRTPRCGRCWPWRCRRWRPRLRAFPDAQPADTRLSRRRSPPTRSSPTWSPPTCTPPPRTRPRRVDLVHRLGELDVPGGAGGHPRLHEGRDDAPDDPCVPRAWTEFRIEYRYGTSRYVITASRAAPGVSPRVLLDGAEVPEGSSR